jgi:hypothetical protein
VDEAFDPVAERADDGCDPPAERRDDDADVGRDEPVVGAPVGPLRAEDDAAEAGRADEGRWVRVMGRGGAADKLRVGTVALFSGAKALSSAKSVGVACGKTLSTYAPCCVEVERKLAKKNAISVRSNWRWLSIESVCRARGIYMCRCCALESKVERYSVKMSRRDCTSSHTVCEKIAF